MVTEPRLVLSDCVDAMRAMEPCSVDAVVTDPPYSLGFMGREWDSHEGEDAGLGYWLSGLIDGEGHFRVQRQARGSFSCAFSIKMRADDRAALDTARRFLGVGSITDEPARDGSRPQAKLNVQAKADCLRVVEVLTRYPLRAKKLRDFLPWAEAVVEWNEMKRGHRWSGRADWRRMEALKLAVERAREYRDPPWSGNGYQDWTRVWAEEALRVLRPGGHLLAFGGTRTFHRLAAGVEDAGFEVRDTLAWLYGSGFPKSLDVSRAIDRHLGVEDDAPASAEAEERKGWGTALKPAFEPVVVARKPLEGTVAANVLRHGTGALNVDACRVAAPGGSPAEARRESSRRSGRTPADVAERREEEGRPFGYRGAPEVYMEARDGERLGRWPANVTLGHTEHCVRVGVREVVGTGHTPASRPASAFAANAQQQEEERSWRRENVEAWDCRADCAVRLLDEQSGVLTSGVLGPDNYRGQPRFQNAYGDAESSGRVTESTFGGDSGGASRFFYVAKTSRAERAAGLEDGNNHHPTVKPVDLMRWLVRLVAPPGGLVLDPFLGSGTTGIAAALEGMRFVGVEREPDYMAVAEARIRWWATHGEGALDRLREREHAARDRDARADAGQLDLFDGLTPGVSA